MAEADPSTVIDENNDDDESDFNGSETNHICEDDRECKHELESFDSTILIERSQSDAALSLKDIHQSLLNSAASIERLDDQPLSGNRVSESSRVFFDLSKIDTMEMDSISTACSAMKEARKKLRLNQSLETIHQNEVLDIAQPKSVRSSSFTFRSLSSETLDEIDESDDSVEAEHKELNHGDPNSFYTKYPLMVNQSLQHGSSNDTHNTWQNKNNLKLKYQKLCASMERDISVLKRAAGAEEIKPLGDILAIMTEAWDVPVYGRDLAYCLCDIIRNESVLSLIVKNTGTDNKELLFASSSLLEQVMSTKNREYIAEHGLEVVVKMTKKAIGNNEMAKNATGILENLFKVNESTASKVIAHGGLDALLYWCRSSDTAVLRKCAKALSNLSLFGGCENQEIMTQQKVPEWLFPLAFMEDNHVRYYACLCIALLASNKELEAAVMKSGTLDLVIPFVSSIKPDVFAKSDYAHKQGRDPVWLKRLKPLLSSRRPEAQALAAFHFAMEATIKKEQGKSGVFYDIEVIEPLRKVASSPDSVASRLASQALQLIGEEVPHKLSQQVPLWTVEDVAHWVSEVGFSDYCSKFQDCQIDGDMLLQMQEEDLIESICMTPGMTRKRFQRELVNLKVTADYSSYDPTKIDPWLMSVLPELSQYTYVMLRHGMDRQLLASTSEEELKDECGVTNGIHRRIIMQHLSDLRSPGGVMSRSSIDFGASLSICPRPVDVFISYRRSTGSQLASLLKVHLQLRGFSVFLDIDRLRAGKFDENLLMNIKLAKHFLLVLTNTALDRCIGDLERQDWVHKEIVTALESNCNIIPILDNCEWPEPEQLPEDMRQVCYFNAIRWVHEYQDACINKLESFLKGLLKSLPDKMCHSNKPIQSPSSIKSPGSLPSPGSVGKFLPRMDTLEMPKPADWWIHDYQDACIDKIRNFLRGNTPTPTNPGHPLKMLELAKPQKNSLAPSCPLVTTQDKG